MVKIGDEFKSRKHPDWSYRVKILDISECFSYIKAHCNLCDQIHEFTMDTFMYLFIEK
jgi:hypothetical protein